ncbi:MAG: hypothetical protein AB7N76_24230 [Planctomycetota bacterium]
MESEQYNALVRRIEAQEAELARLRRGRSWKRLGGSILAVGAAVVLMGQAAPPSATQKEVSAQSFVIRDDQGKVRAVFGLAKDGEIACSMTDPAGKQRIQLAVSKKGVPGINVNDANGENRVGIGFANDGLAFVALRGPKGKIQNFNFVDGNGNPRLVLKDADGKKLHQVP